MIYVIINQSHEWDEPLFETIEYAGTSLEEVEKIWNEYYSKYGTIDDGKWCYAAELREYSNGYFLYSLEKSSYKILKTISNDN